MKEIKSVIKEKEIQRLQCWDNETKMYLHALQRKVEKGRSSEGKRREESIISGLRMGHTGLCEWCGQGETIEHVIINCRKYEEEKKLLRCSHDAGGASTEEHAALLGLVVARKEKGL
ncbi:hypothetical protein H4Q32_000763 [Labeo rohita]|uniref:Reverse transcriptase zinc-binding domain-containing protein n=1 Tax=Labeo rohita TaxID=84645 RepID=A0ABQ8LJW0_LABRO|nr:hypothetical protein H4Q32_000763 [Labeo rohita]